MKFWRRNVNTLTRDQIDHSIADPIWQSFRLSLKGIPTGEKLDLLEQYLSEQEREFGVGNCLEAQVQVDNYINALLRGGQLRRICANTIIVAK